MRSHYGKNDKRKYAELSYESRYLLDPKYMTKRDMQHYYRYYGMAKGRSQFKKVVLIVFCICFFSYIFVDYNLKTKLIQLKDRFDFVPRIEADYNVTPAYFIDTAGCRMPYFNVTDDNIVQFMFPPEEFTCRKSLVRTAPIGAQLLLNLNDAEMLDLYNITDLQSIHCVYTEIRRRNDQENDYLRTLEFRLEPNRTIHILPGIEFIRVECFDVETTRIYHDFHFFAIDKQRPLRTTPTPAEFWPPSAEPSVGASAAPPVERLSVMILGIDSVSHLNFLRQMRRTAEHIRRRLPHVELWGYNKVGDNTYPNLVPMLSGLDETELKLACLSPTKVTTYDRCSFIWKRYKEAGYRTAYAEDVATLGLFNFFRPGFQRQPTDYYLRPIMLEMEQHISYRQNINVELCKGGRRTADVVFELIEKLQPLLRTRDFFSFFWTVTMTHDLLNMPALLDDDVVRLLDQLEASAVLNRTLLFLMSDHGLRWGSFRKTYQGMMEERQPLLLAIYPPWFRAQYPTAVANLEANAKRLTTHFDLHATLLDLIDLRHLESARLAERADELKETDTLPRGISLFLPVPEGRTCETAGIASHWCTCHQRQEMATNDGRVQRAARHIVKLINERLKAHPKCRSLYLNSILAAVIAAPHTRIVKDVTDDYGIDITVRIQTKPGLGLFESTVRMSSYATALTGTISRINLYGSQSYCIDDYALKMFCYCHR